jgi:hypothetical protein
MSKPFDAHDDQERREIVAILDELPADHKAWQLHAQVADAIRLSHHVDCPALRERLTKGWIGGYNRMLRRISSFRLVALRLRTAA